MTGCGLDRNPSPSNSVKNVVVPTVDVDYNLVLWVAFLLQHSDTRSTCLSSYRDAVLLPEQRHGRRLEFPAHMTKQDPRQTAHSRAIWALIVYLLEVASSLLI